MTLSVIPCDLHFDEVLKARQTFNSLVDHEFIFSDHHLRQVLSKMGLFPPEDQVQVVMEHFRDKLSFTHFCRFLSFLKGVFRVPDPKDADTLRAFVALGGGDETGDRGGEIRTDDLRNVCKNVFSLTIDIDKLILEVDKSQDGKVNYDEFKDMWRASQVTNLHPPASSSAQAQAQQQQAQAQAQQQQQQSIGRQQKNNNNNNNNNENLNASSSSTETSPVRVPGSKEHEGKTNIPFWEEAVRNAHLLQAEEEEAMMEAQRQQLLLSGGGRSGAGGGGDGSSAGGDDFDAEGSTFTTGANQQRLTFSEAARTAHLGVLLGGINDEDEEREMPRVDQLRLFLQMEDEKEEREHYFMDHDISAAAENAQLEGGFARLASFKRSPGQMLQQQQMMQQTSGTFNPGSSQQQMFGDEFGRSVGGGGNMMSQSARYNKSLRSNGGGGKRGSVTDVMMGGNNNNDYSASQGGGMPDRQASYSTYSYGAGGSTRTGVPSSYRSLQQQPSSSSTQQPSYSEDFDIPEDATPADVLKFAQRLIDDQKKKISTKSVEVDKKMEEIIIEEKKLQEKPPSYIGISERRGGDGNIGIDVPIPITIGGTKKDQNHQRRSSPSYGSSNGGSARGSIGKRGWK